MSRLYSTGGVRDALDAWRLKPQLPKPACAGFSGLSVRQGADFVCKLRFEISYFTAFVTIQHGND
jgi:hypothetical protein